MSILYIAYCSDLGFQILPRTSATVVYYRPTYASSYLGVQYLDLDSFVTLLKVNDNYFFLCATYMYLKGYGYISYR